MIDESTWEDNTRDEGAPVNSTLWARADFFGVPFHVTAIQVRGGMDEPDGPREQRAVDPGSQEDLDRVHEINGDWPCYTCEIPGFPGAYVLVMIPYAA